MSLEVRGLFKKIGRFELRAEFRVEPRERLALTGPSGSGKTSLLRLLAGLDRMDSGEIRLSGRDLSVLPPERRRIGYLSQGSSLFPQMTLEENVGFALRLRGERTWRETARGWLKRVHLEARASDPVTRLSGGEQQRVALARALCWKPDAILLDEPFSALDAGLRQELQEMVRGFHAEMQVPLVFVSHQVSEVAELATSELRVEGDAQSFSRSFLR
jgi:ABC-type Fe3+/spermidine/putrescine transport system ATPase subunit